MQRLRLAPLAHEVDAHMMAERDGADARRRSRLLGALRRLDAWLEHHPRPIGLCLYLAAIALRAVHLASFRDTLLARVFLMDEAFYYEEAWNLVRGVPPPTDSWFMTPLYPLFLSVVFRLAGDAPAAAYAVQLVLGAFAAPLTHALARRCMRPSWACLAGLAMASFAPTVFFEALLLVEWMVGLALLTACYCALRSPSSCVGAGLAGACLGLATLGRGSNLLLALPLGLWFWRHADGARRRAARVAGVFLAGCALVLAPLLVYNALNAAQPLLLTANAGFNLYLGNGPEATGIFALPDRLDMQQDPLALRYVQRETHVRVTASEASRFWLRKTLDSVREHPARAAKLLAWKLLLFWNRFPFPQLESFEVEARSLPIGRPPFWSSHALFPLGLVGMGLAFVSWARGRRRRPALPHHAAAALLAACTALYALSIALFFITDRYRMPAVPWLIVLSALALATGGEALAAGARRRVLAMLLAAAATFWLTDPTLLGIDQARVARDLRVHHALRLAKAADFEAALGEYRAVLQTAPEDATLRDGLARMYARAGRDSLAILTLQSLLTDQPQLSRSWYNLGNVYRRGGRYHEAVLAYGRALKLDPERESVWNNLGETQRALGDTAAAAAAYQRALEIVPAHEQALNNLAALRGFQGDARSAEAGFRAAIEANPRYAPAWINLAILLTNNGRYDEALPAWKRILALEPDNELAARTLREVEAARGSKPAKP